MIFLNKFGTFCNNMFNYSLMCVVIHHFQLNIKLIGCESHQLTLFSTKCQNENFELNALKYTMQKTVELQRTSHVRNMPLNCKM